MKLVKVKDYPNLCRDLESNAVINVDSESYKQHLERKKFVLAEKEKIKRHDEEINNIKQELCDIKSLLMQILDIKNASTKNNS